MHSPSPLRFNTPWYTLQPLHRPPSLARRHLFQVGTKHNFVNPPLAPFKNGKNSLLPPCRPTPVARCPTAHRLPPTNEPARAKPPPAHFNLYNSTCIRRVAGAPSPARPELRDVHTVRNKSIKGRHIWQKMILGTSNTSSPAPQQHRQNQNPVHAAGRLVRLPAPFVGHGQGHGHGQRY
jgi:hypothetical protein